MGTNLDGTPEKLTTEAEVVELMESSTTEEEWKVNCDRVLADFKGYPDFWYRAIMQSGLADKVTKKFGKDAEIKIVPLQPVLQPLMGISGRPNRMPYVPNGHAVYCGFDQGLGEKIMLCSTLEDMQKAYDGYASGYAIRIRWYSGVAR